MIQRWLIVDEIYGCVLRCGQSLEVPEGAILAPAGMEPANLVRHRLVDGAWVERPSAEMGLTATGVAYLNVPDGSAVEVFDIMSHVSMGIALVDENGDIIVDLPDSGEYALSGYFPLPYLATEHRITK